MTGAILAENEENQILVERWFGTLKLESKNLQIRRLSKEPRPELEKTVRLGGYHVIQKEKSVKQHVMKY